MSLRDRVNALLKSTATDIDAIIGDAALAKAADGEMRSVTDSWQVGEKHSSISAEDVKTGPKLAADGDNTAKMNTEYSSNAAQSGTQADAERMQAGFRELHATMKAIWSVLKGHDALFTAILKADEPEDKEKDDYTEKAKARSTNLFTEAKALFAKANTLRKAADEMDDEDDKAAAKAIKSRVRASIKLGTIKLSKARRSAYIAGDVALVKSITELAVKSDVDMYDDEDLEKAEDSEDALEKAATGLAATAKAEDEDETAKAAAKAKTDDKGHQADAKDPASGNQAASAKGTIDPAELQMVLKGLGTLTTTVHGLVDLVNGTSKAAPVVVKSDVLTDNGKPMLLRIAEAQDNGLLTPGQAVDAQSLAAGYDAVVKGTVDKRSWQARLELAPAAVRALYADLAA